MNPIRIHLAAALLLTTACATPRTASTDASLPLDLHDGKYLYVEGEIEGTKTDIVLDSGAGITVVDQGLANRLGLVGGTEITAQGVGGERNVKLADNVTIRLGGVTLAPMTVAILNLEEVHQKLGRTMPVILGKELFHAFPVTIDYPARRVVIHDPSHFEAPAHTTAVPTRSIEQGHVAVEAQLEDLPTAWFMIDTGSGGSVDFHAPYVEANSLLKRYPRQGTLQASGVGGSRLERVVVARSVTLAGQTFRSVPVALATEGPGAFSASSSSGTIGAGLLGRFVVTFDLANERMFFEPGPDVDAPFEKDRLGLSCAMTDGHPRVDYVSPGSPAAESGLIVGDEITAVDGIVLPGTELMARLRDVKHAKSGTLVQLTLRDGTVRRVKLADYF
jgi:predicted aspartyl protease